MELRAAIPEGSVVTQALVLALVAVGITGAVYGAVALIVKADDAGLALAQNRQDSVIAGMGRMIGRALVLGMPFFLTFLSAAGTAAMIWVGGGIIVHGMEAYGLSSIAEAIHAAANAAAQALSPLAGVTEWIVTAAGGALVGLLIGALFIPVIGYVVAPAWKLVKGILGYERTGPKP